MPPKSPINLEIKNLSDSFNFRKYDKLIDQVKAFNFVEHNENTKSSIAKLFVHGFFIAILCSVILPMIYNIALFYLFGKDSAKDYLYNGKEILLVVTSAIGTPLGFIIGYYFKEGKK